MNRRELFRLALLLGATGKAVPQERIRVDVNEAEAPIRVDVNLVSVAFTARDAHGTLAADLSKDDFELFEDGVPQKIAFFARSADVPLTLGLIMDMSGSQEHFMKPHHRDLELFMKAVMTARDQAFLVCFGNHVRLVSDFSPSAPALLDALRRFEKGDRHFPEFAPEDERELGTAFYDSIYHAVDQRLARSVSGRRVLLLFTDGEDNSSAHHMMDAIEAAQAADVRVYAVRYTESKGGHLSARNKYGMRVMDRIARETGGQHYDARQGDMGRWFRQISEELHAMYELSYHSTNVDRDGSFRKILIHSRRADLVVRAKTGYFARP